MSTSSGCLDFASCRSRYCGDILADSDSLAAIIPEEPSSSLSLSLSLWHLPRCRAVPALMSGSSGSGDGGGAVEWVAVTGTWLSASVSC